MGALLGRSIGEVLDLPISELTSWRKYWGEEPWGSYRDNMHAGLMISHFLRPHMKQGARAPSPFEFMFKVVDEPTEEQHSEREAKAQSVLKAFRRMADRQVH